MKLVAKVRGEVPILVEAMKEIKGSARLVKGATIVELPQAVKVERKTMPYMRLHDGLRVGKDDIVEIVEHVSEGEVTGFTVARDISRVIPDTYTIPAPVQALPHHLELEITEHGGGMTGTGSGTVVCGEHGERLRPFRVPQGGHLANGVHAYFAVREPGCVTVTGFRLSWDVRIERVNVERDGNAARIATTEVWYGDLRELPSMYSEFEAAAKAASDKGDCYHCRHVHFAI